MDKGRCACSACWPDYPFFRVCATCGNKRCPHATDHRLTCTNSNEPGQPGSSYGLPKPTEPVPAAAGETDLRETIARALGPSFQPDGPAVRALLPIIDRHTASLQDRASRAERGETRALMQANDFRAAMIAAEARIRDAYEECARIADEHTQAGCTLDGVDYTVGSQHCAKSIAYIIRSRFQEGEVQP